MSTDRVTDAVADAGVVLNERGSLWSRLYEGRTNYEFVRSWKKWALFSGTLILVGLLTLGLRGFNLGIEFKGGTQYELKRNSMSIATATSAFNSVSKEKPVVQLLGTDKILLKGLKSTESERSKIRAALAKKAGLKSEEVNVTFVGPSWGKDVSRKALKALIIFFLVIAAYISLRFEWKMAAAALTAVLHDVLITVGFYALTGFEVSPATVIAFLTILGFSLYDTIVVFDKVKENATTHANGKLAYTDVVNLSMNQVLMRSLNTSFVAVLPVLSMLILGVGILGAVAIRDFALALLIGILIGAYSSIFVASPMLAYLKEREETWAAVRAKLGGKGLTAEAAARARSAIGAAGDSIVTDVKTAGGVSAFPNGQPRGRKLGKKR
jgi:preprotein translocase subunit SecF